MKKVVLKLDVHDGKEKQKAMKAVSCLRGVDSISMDMKEKKLTVIGDVDPVDVVNKLRKKQWYTEILTVGPAKEEKKDDEKKGDGKKKDGNQKFDPFKGCYHPYMPMYCPVVRSEETPISCVIC